MRLKSEAMQKIDQCINDLLTVYYDTVPKNIMIQPARDSLKTEYQSYMQEIQDLRGRKLTYPYLGSGKGQGVYVELMDGSIKMDLIGGVGVHLLGHAHPELMKVAVKAGLSDIVMQGHLVMNEEYLLLSRKLIELARRQSRLQYVLLTTSGSMANENALKMARQKNSPRCKILAFDKAFAGRTIMMSEVTANPACKEGLSSYNEVLRIPFYDESNPSKSLNVLKSHLEREADQISTFIFEAVLGEGGYKSAPSSFFLSLITECRKHDIAIWIDEVQTFARTSTFFAFEKWGLGSFIDLCTIGKGAHVGATFCTAEYNPRPGLVAGTFSGSTAALAVSLKTIELMEDKYLPMVGQIENDLCEMFEELKSKKLISDYNTFGLMAAVTLIDSSKEYVMNYLQILFQKGVIAFPCGRDPYRVRFLLPVVIKKSDMQVLKTILETTLSESIK